MKQIDFLEKRRLFIELAQKKKTGIPRELTQKLHIGSERTFFRFLKILKNSGLKFKYDAPSKSYILMEESPSL